MVSVAPDPSGHCQGVLISQLGHSSPAPSNLELGPILDPIVQALANTTLCWVLKGSRSFSGKSKGDGLRRDDPTPDGGANTGPALPTLPAARLLASSRVSYSKSGLV